MLYAKEMVTFWLNLALYVLVRKLFEVCSPLTSPFYEELI